MPHFIKRRFVSKQHSSGIVVNQTQVFPFLLKVDVDLEILKKNVSSFETFVFKNQD